MKNINYKHIFGTSNNPAPAKVN